MRSYLPVAAAFILMAVSSSHGDAFHGLSCEGDACDNLEAGYQWASEKDVTAEAQCKDGPQPLYEGCAAWAREYRSGYDRARADDLRNTSECTGTDAEVAGCQDYVEER